MTTINKFNFTDDSAQDIYSRTRNEYIKNSKKSITIQERIEGLIPWLFLLLQICFFILSASHTVDMVSRFVPGLWSVFSLGIELGLVGLAFMIYRSHHNQQAIHWTWYALESLIFVFVVAANLGGSVLMVVSKSSLESLSFSAVITQLSQLTLTDQIALLVAILFSFIVPIGSVVVGQSIARLFIDRTTGKDIHEVRWQDNAYGFLFPEFLNELIANGLTPGRAKRKAHELAVAYGQKRVETLETVETIQTQKLDTPEMSKAIEWVKSHPELATMPLRQAAELAGVSYSTLRRAKQS